MTQQHLTGRFYQSPSSLGALDLRSWVTVGGEGRASLSSCLQAPALQIQPPQSFHTASRGRWVPSGCWVHLPPWTAWKIQQCEPTSLLLPGAGAPALGEGSGLVPPWATVDPFLSGKRRGVAFTMRLCHDLVFLGKEQMCPGDLSKCLKMGQWQQHCTT